jgi:hypothetical protein
MYRHCARENVRFFAPGLELLKIPHSLSEAGRPHEQGKSARKHMATKHSPCEAGPAGLTSPEPAV